MKSYHHGYLTRWVHDCSGDDGDDGGNLGVFSGLEMLH